MNKLLIGLLSFLLLLTPTAQAQIYKWKDDKGVTRYTDTPPPPSEKKWYTTVISTIRKPIDKASEAIGLKPADGQDAGKPADPNAKTDAAKTPAEKTAADKELDAKRKKVEADEAKKKEDQKLAEKEARAKNCTAAKSNQNTYKDGGRIVRVNEKGEREILDDDAIAAAKAQAAKEVEQWCD